jgi:hypothetical protein
MPTEASTKNVPATGLDAASRRILRLALGVSLSLWFSQAVNWPMSFLAPVFTMFILAVPLPAPSFKGGVVFIVALIGSVLAGMALLPFYLHFPAVGVLLLMLALYGSFYYSARGGSAILGMFLTVGLTFVTAIGTVSIDVQLAVTKGLAMGAVVGILFVWLAHALMPDPRASKPAGVAKPPKPARPDRAQARRSAFRSFVIVFPVAFVLLLSSASASYAVLMIKVASMGQQASVDKSREMGRSLLESTLWGGVAAIIGWQLMKMWPSLVFYVLIIALSALFFGRRIFQGPGMQPKGAMWSYAFLTMIVILAPAVMDGQVGSSADLAFYSRLQLFLLTAVYGTVAVAVFDAFWPQPEATTAIRKTESEAA